MLAKLDLEKKMVFANGRELTYLEALTQLALRLGKEYSMLEKAILEEMTNTILSLNANTKIKEANHSGFIGLFKWVQSIHNDKLAVPSGARFPNNIIYDLLIILRNKENLTAEETLLHFFLEGSNARKISNGQTPGLAFVASSFAVNVAIAVHTILKDKQKECSLATLEFYTLYSSLTAFIPAQRLLENSFSRLKKSNLFEFLSANDVFQFARQENPATGANQYMLEDAVVIGLRALKEYESNLELSLYEMVSEIKELIFPLLAHFQEAADKATSESFEIAKWDASEWFSRIFVALRIAADSDTQYIDVLDHFMKNKAFNSIISQSKTGCFPAKLRDHHLSRTDFIELFQQNQVATIANIQPLMWAQSTGEKEAATFASNIPITNEITGIFS